MLNSLDFFDDPFIFHQFQFRYRPRADAESKAKSELQLPRLEIEDIINQEELKNFLEDFKCPICINIIEDPKTCVSCEANFCGDCIREWTNQDGDKKCPCCRDQGQERFLQQRERGNRFTFRVDNDYGIQNKYVSCPKIFKKLLGAIQITCHNKDCNTIIKFDERISHLKVCLYQLHKCQNEGCEERVTKLTEDQHNLVCEYRKEPCKYCQDQISIKEMLLHEDFCTENKMQCLDCNESLQIQKMIEHERVCQYKRIECKICNNKFYRKCFSYHTKAKCYEKLYKNSQKEIKKKERILSSQDEKIHKMEQFIQELQSQLTSVEGEMFDKNTLIQSIIEFRKLNIPEEDHNINNDDFQSEEYPDDFESFEKTTVKSEVDEIDSNGFKFCFHQNFQHSHERKNYEPIRLCEDTQNYPYTYSFDCTIKSVQSDTAQPQSQWSQQMREEEEEKHNDDCNNTQNRNRNQQFLIGENDQTFQKGIRLFLNETNPPMDQHNIFNGSYTSSINKSLANSANNLEDDTYLGEMFINSQDRKEFFLGVEENLLL